MLPGRPNRISRRWTAVPLVMATVALLTMAGPASAQIDRGQIAGFVKDQTGGVIPGATVTATNVQTRIGRTVVTDATGYYIFTALSPGAYNVEAELEGFKKWVKTGVPLDAASSITVDVTLQTGALTESVTVIALGFSPALFSSYEKLATTSSSSASR